MGGKTRDQVRQIVAEQRLAAGEPQLGDAETDEDPRETVDLLEGENRRARQPHVFRLRHAVAAPHVAAIGDRDPQTAEWPMIAVGEAFGQEIDHGDTAAAWTACVGSTHSSRAVFVRLALPDRHPPLQLLDHVAAGDERFVPVSAGDRDRDGGVADLQPADAVSQRDRHRPPGLRLGDDRAHSASTIGCVRRILEAQHRAPAVVVPHRAEEAGDAAPLVGLHLANEWREVNRSIGEESPPSASGERRKDRELVPPGHECVRPHVREIERAQWARRQGVAARQRAHPRQDGAHGAPGWRRSARARLGRPSRHSSRTAGRERRCGR